jgi:hypothetical protein
VHPDVRQRPASASKIRTRILRIYRHKITPRFVAMILWRLIFKIGEICFKLVWGICRAIAWIITSIFRFIFQIIKACVNTVWAMIVGGLGGFVGAVAGYWLTYLSPMSPEINSFVTEELPRWVPEVSVVLKPEMVVFVAAGLATAWSLTRTKSLGKCLGKQAGRLGILGYLLGWFLWQGAAPNGAGLVGTCAIAAYFLTLGLGLPRRYLLVYAIAVAGGTAGLFASLITFLPAGEIYSLSDAFSQWGWSEPGTSLAFFSLLGIVLGFWLGISHYIFIPFLRLLGWR